MVKSRYDLNKILYRFKRVNPGIEPKGHFYYKNEKIDDLNKTCGELEIKDGDNIILK